MTCGDTLACAPGQWRCTRTVTQPCDLDRSNRRGATRSSALGRILLRSEFGPKIPTVGNSSSDQKIRFLLTKFQQSLKLSNSDLAEKSDLRPKFGPGGQVRSWRVRGGGIPSAISRNTIAQQLRQHLMRGLYNPCRLALLVEAPPTRARVGACSRKNRLFFLLASNLALKRPEQLLT